MSQADEEDDEELQRRILRADARKLLKKVTQDEAEDVVDPTKNTWSKLHDKSDTLFEKVSKPREATCEGEVFVELAKASHKKVDKLGEDSIGHDKRGFIEGLRRNFFDRNGDLDEDSGGDFLWEKLGKSLCFASRCVPRMEIMLGPIDIVAKPKKTPKKRERTKEPTKLTRPGEVNRTIEKQRKQNRQSKRLKIMKKQLAARTEDGQRTNDFFPFVINPKSFTQTVENLFDYSFLVKQGDASIRFEDGVPAARPEEMNVASTFKKTQCVATFTMKDWEELKEVHNIDDDEDGEIPMRTAEDEEEEEDPDEDEDSEVEFDGEDEGGSSSQQY